MTPAQLAIIGYPAAATSAATTDGQIRDAIQAMMAAKGLDFPSAKQLVLAERRQQHKQERERRIMFRSIAQWLEYYHCDEAVFRACVGDLKQYRDIQHMQIVLHIDADGNYGLMRTHRRRMRWRIEQYNAAMG